MPELTKKHRIKKIDLHFTGPAEKKTAAISALTRLGFSPAKNIPTSDSWRDNFPELQGNEAGVILTGARHREALTQRELSSKSGIPQRHISEMENDKRSIGKKNAKALAKVLNTDYRVFL